MRAQIEALRSQWDEITEEIRETEALLQHTAHERAWVLTLDSLRARQEQVAEGLRAALRDIGMRQLVLSFDGGPVRGASISALFLAEVLEQFQRLFDAIGGAKTRGPDWTGEPHPIMSSTALTIEAYSTGSFEVRLTGFDAPVLFGDPFITSCIDDLHRLLEIGDDPRALKKALKKLGPVVRDHLAKLMGVLVNDQADLQLESWARPDRMQAASVSHAKAGRIADTVERLRSSSEDTVVITGKLIGLMQNAERFELQDSATNRVYRGKVKAAVIRRAADLFDNDVTADFEIVTRQSLGDPEASVTWTLIGVHPGEE